MPGFFNKIHRYNLFKGYIPTVIALCMGVGLSIGAFFLFLEKGTMESRRSFDRNALMAAMILKGEIERNHEVMDGVKAFFKGSYYVNRSEFDVYTSHALSHHNDIQAIEWIPRVLDSQRKKFEVAARQEGFADFAFKELDDNNKLRVAQRRPEYFPVYYMAPYKGNEKALGLDLASNPARKSALENARDTGKMTATERILLVQETKKQYGFLVFDPIYRTGLQLDSVEERRKNLRGFVLMVFRFNNMVDASLENFIKEGLAVKLWDISNSEQMELLYASDNNVSDKFYDIKWGGDIEIAGRKWLIEFQGKTHIPYPLVPWVFLFLGLLITGIAGSYFLNLKRYAEEMERSTDALMRSEEDLIRAQESAHIGNWRLDLHTNEIACSLETYRIFDIPADILITYEKFLEALHPEDREYADQLWKKTVSSRQTCDFDCRIIPGGKVKWVNVRADVLFDDTGASYGIGTIQDITGRKRIFKALKTLSACNEALVRSMNEKELFDKICRVIIEHGGYRLAWIAFKEDNEAKTVRVVAKAGFDEGYTDKLNLTWADTERGLGPTGTVIRTGMPIIAKDLKTEPSFAPWRDEALKRGYASSIALPLLINNNVIGTLNIYAAETDAFDKEESALLAELVGDLSYGIASLRTKEEQRKAEAKILRAKHEWEMTFDAVIDPIMILDLDFRILRVNKALAERLGKKPLEMVGLTCYEYMHESKEPPAECPYEKFLKDGNTYKTEIYDKMLGGWFVISVSPIYDENGELIGAVHSANDITERKQAENALIERERLLSESQRIAHIGSWKVDIATGAITWTDETYRIYGVSKETFKLTLDEFYALIHIEDRGAMLEWVRACMAGERPVGIEFRIVKSSGGIKVLYGSGELYLDAENKLAYMVGTVQDITEKKMSEELIKKQLDRTRALRTIDMAISSSLDLRLTLDIFLQESLNQLHVDAACILLYNRAGQRLEYAAGLGFRTSYIKSTSMRLGEAYAGKVAYEREPVIFHDINKADAEFVKSALISHEGFKAYAGMPLIAKGNIKGVLEVFNRSSLPPEPEWFDFLDSLAGQAAIAIDNSTLFGELQKSNIELIMAYDSTIEGWSRALDFRDKETEGHSQRVTDLTVTIAKEMGVGNDELVHLRRGALLHDIGKLGIPDGILLKPGKLTEDEWKIMKTHPIIAHQILSPISFLRLSLDIPLSHHEKWNGTGYPNGLKGEEIPLSARIFSVVDVWDALRSDRPYRPAWTREKTLDYIKSLSEVEFDPEVVKVFLKLIFD